TVLPAQLLDEFRSHRSVADEIVDRIAGGEPQDEEVHANDDKNDRQQLQYAFDDVGCHRSVYSPDLSFAGLPRFWHESTHSWQTHPSSNAGSRECTALSPAS